MRSAAINFVFGTALAAAAMFVHREFSPQMQLPRFWALVILLGLIVIGSCVFALDVPRLAALMFPVGAAAAIFVGLFWFAVHDGFFRETWWQPPALSLIWSTPVAILGSASAIAARTLLPSSRAHRRWRSNRCPDCGYDRTGITTETPCPECGASFPSTITPSAQR